LKVDGVKYQAHRLAWLYVYGYLPENDIDHIDRIKGNNRIENLREVSKVCNLRNTGNIRSNTSGVKGVSFINKKHKWQAQIMINRTSFHLGYFTSFTEAVCHRLAAEQCVDWEGCDSSSPSFVFIQKHIDRK